MESRNTNSSRHFQTIKCRVFGAIGLSLFNHLGGGSMVRTWDQEVCSLCGLRFKPCGYSYDGHWRLTWSLTSGPVGLVEVHASWTEHPR